MLVDTLAIKFGTLQQVSPVSDGAFGHTDDWVAVGPIRFRIGTVRGQQKVLYARQGWERVIRLQCPNKLPTRLLGKWYLHELFTDVEMERLRVVYKGRTFTLVGVSHPNEGQVPGGAEVFNLDVVETPQPVGFQDQA